MDFSDKQKIDRTRLAFLLTHLLRAPFWALYHLLIFILYRDLNASAFQIALFIALKPVVSIFSIYWGAHIHNRPDRLRANIIWGGVLSYVPFLFFPICKSSWFILVASALFMMLYRGVVPAWMEVFKRNLPGEQKQKVFALAAFLSFALGAPLPLVIGPLLDKFPTAWPWLFVGAALLGCVALFFQLRIPVDPEKKPICPSPSLRGHLLSPWKAAFTALKTNALFRAHHVGFMLIGGCGLMLIQPALPKFFVDSLGLSYTELSFALTLCKGVAFALTSPLWAKLMPRYNFFRFSASITTLAAIFPFVLLSALFNHVFIYVAYLAYGAMQAGSELTWHLSGPHFAKQEDSSVYSNVNILTVGLRGLIIPQLGAVLCLLCPVVSVLALGAVICIIGALQMTLYANKQRLKNKLEPQP